jgi:hypothetical protein
VKLCPLFHYLITITIWVLHRLGALRPSRLFFSPGLPSFFPFSSFSPLIFPAQAHRISSPVRPSWAPPPPPPHFPLLGSVAHGPLDARPFLFLERPSSSFLARQPGVLARALRAAYSRQARRDGSATMQSGGRFSNFRPRFSRPHRENHPRHPSPRNWPSLSPLLNPKPLSRSTPHREKTESPIGAPRGPRRRPSR